MQNGGRGVALRYIFGATQAGSDLLNTALGAVRRFDWTPTPGSWRLEDFWANFGWLITTSVAIIVCSLWSLENAGVFLIIAVVHSVLVGGYRTGLASATLATLYAAIFLSTPDQMFRFSGEGFRGLLGLTVAAYGVVFLIMHLRQTDLAAAARKAEEIRAVSTTAQSEALFRNMADGLPVPLWIADTRGNRFFWNQHWSRVTGLSPTALSGKGWHKMIHPEDAAFALQRYADAVRSCERFEAEYRVRASNGEYRWLQDFAVPRIGPDGDFLGYLGSCVDRTDRKRVESALHQLSGKLLEMQDDERRRISRELHDTTAQNLAVLSMNLCVVKDAVKIMGAKTQKAVTESLAIAEQCSQEIRTLSYLLHPPLLDELGLVSALRAYTTGYSQRTGISIEFKMAEIGRLPGEVETTLFRIVQEALTNVHRHSGSTKAEIRVMRDPMQVRLQVGDEGRGVPPDRLELISEGANVGVGIAGMRERAIQLGGQLKVASSDRGTTITAILPLPGKT